MVINEAMNIIPVQPEVLKVTSLPGPADFRGLSAPGRHVGTEWKVGALVPLPALPFEIRNGEKTEPSAQPLGATSSLQPIAQRGQCSLGY